MGLKLFNGEDADNTAVQYGLDAHHKYSEIPEYKNKIYSLNPYNHQSNRYFSWLLGWNIAENIEIKKA